MEKLKNNPSQARQKSLSIRQAVLFQGPLPPPEILAKYEQITPGFADRIVTMAEQVANHRREVKNKNQKSQNDHLKRRDCEAKLGQVFAFLISSLAIVTGAFVAMSGHDVSGTFISLSGLGGIVTAFIYGRKEV